MASGSLLVFLAFWQIVFCMSERMSSSNLAPPNALPFGNSELPLPSCDPTAGIVCLPDACAEHNTCEINPKAVCIPDRCGCEAKFFLKEEIANVTAEPKSVRDISMLCKSFNKVAKIMHFHQPQSDESEQNDKEDVVPGTPLHLSLNRGLYQLLGEVIRSVDNEQNMTTEDKTFIVRQANHARHALKRAFKILSRVNRLIGLANEDAVGFDVNVTVANMSSSMNPDLALNTLARQKRQAYPYGFGYPTGGAATGISTGGALQGITNTNSGTMTNPYGSSAAFGNGMSAGFQPHAETVTNSASGSPFGRRKRDASDDGLGALEDGSHRSHSSYPSSYGNNKGYDKHNSYGSYNGYGKSKGYDYGHGSSSYRSKRGDDGEFGPGEFEPQPYPFAVPASGSAISTGNAIRGRSLTNSGTHTSPFGLSNSFANGMSEGYGPSSTSISNSNSARRKRQSMAMFDSPLISPYGFFDPYLTMGSTGSTLASGNALSGRSDTNGQTFTDANGGTAAVSQGSSTGNQPQSTSAAGSTSTNSGSAILPRQKRQAELDYDDYGMYDPDFDVEFEDTPSLREPTRAEAIAQELRDSTGLLKKAYDLNLQIIQEILKKDGVFHDSLEQSDLAVSSAADPEKLKGILSGVSGTFSPLTTTTERPKKTTRTTTVTSTTLLSTSTQ